jgi:hypothetical protein
MDQTLHALLHARARGRDELVVVDLYRAGGDAVEALADNAERLAHLLHAAQVAVIAVTVFADGDVEFDLVPSANISTREREPHFIILVIPLHLAQVPRNPAPAHHHAAEAIAARVIGADDAYADGALLPDAVPADNLLDLIDPARELRRPLEDVVQQAMGEVERDAPGAHVRRVEARAADALVKLHELLALLEAPQERRERADVQRMAMRWLRMRVISPNSVRIHFARSGTSMLSSFSTARE